MTRRRITVFGLYAAVGELEPGTTISLGGGGPVEGETAFLRFIDHNTCEVLTLPLGLRGHVLVAFYRFDYRVGRAWRWLVRRFA